MSSTSCAEAGCSELPIFSCSCDKSLFLCQYHVGKHLLSVGVHIPTSLYILVPENQKSIVFKYLSLKKELAKQNLKDLINSANELLKFIINETKQEQKKLILEQNYLNTILKTLNKTSMLEKDILEAAISGKKIIEKNFKSYLNEISLFLSKLYTSECKKVGIKDDYALMFRTVFSNEIDLIDLETYRKSTISFSVSDLAYECGCCNIGENKYFVYGGYGSAYSSSTKIIDIKAKSVESLPSDSPLAYHGLSLFNDEVYCFGGYTGSNYTNISKKFDLKKRVWTIIQPLPQANHFNSASTLDNQILVFGYQSAELFNFNPDQNSFTTKFSFTTNTMKFIFENWIVVFGKGLYQIDYDSKLIKKQEFNDQGDFLNSSANFRRGNNIYFLVHGPKLYRIKTDSGSIEQINFV